MHIKPDVHVTIATAQAIIDRALPGRTVAAVSSIHGGDIAAVWEIALAAPEPAVVLKLYPDSLQWKMQKEVNVSTLIQGRLSVPMPRILFADDTKALIDFNFVVMTKLEGSILRWLEPALTPGQLASAYMQIGRLLREFHRIPMDAFGYIGPNGIWTAYATNHAYMAFQFDKKLKEFIDQGGAASLARQVAAHVAERNELLHACTLPVLCHNDLHTTNLLAKTTEDAVCLSGVLDFEGALAGDPLMDVAKALYYVSEGNGRALLEGYGDTARPQWSQSLSLYHLYFVLELWCWMAQIGNRGALDQLTSDLARFSAA